MNECKACEQYGSGACIALGYDAPCVNRRDSFDAVSFADNPRCPACGLCVPITETQATESSCPECLAAWFDAWMAHTSTDGAPLVVSPGPDAPADGLSVADCERRLAELYASERRAAFAARVSCAAFLVCCNAVSVLAALAVMLSHPVAGGLLLVNAIAGVAATAFTVRS